MGTIKNAVYKVDNGTDFDEIHFKTKAAQVFCEDGKTVEEQLVEKVKYTDLTPIVTTGTSSAYIATIPTNMVEVTIVPHINNLQGATLNGIAILDREGKPIEKDTLVANIPTKIVRVGSNFFLASGGGKGKYDSIVKKIPLATQNNFNMLYDINVIPALTLAGIADTKNSSIMLIGNDLYYFGGVNLASNSFTKSIRKINMETGVITTPSFYLPNYFVNSTGLEYQDKVYIFGGNLQNDRNMTIHVYDKILDKCTEKYTGTVLLGNRGVIYNNNLYIDSGVVEMQIYSISSNTITTKQLPNYGGGYYDSFLLELNGEIYVFTEQKSINSFKYNTTTGTFSNLTNSNSLSPTYIKCVFKKGANIYIVTDNNKLLIYDTVLNTWSGKVANGLLFDAETFCKTYDNDVTYMFSRNARSVALLEVQ